MSNYGTFGVTVSPRESQSFLDKLAELDFRPDKLYRQDDGSVSALWIGWNHLDDDQRYLDTRGYLDELDTLDYVFEYSDDWGCSDSFGRYCFGYETHTEYVMYGSPISLPARSKNRRRTIAGRR